MNLFRLYFRICEIIYKYVKKNDKYNTDIHLNKHLIRNKKVTMFKIKFHSENRNRVSDSKKPKHVLDYPNLSVRRLLLTPTRRGCIKQYKRKRQTVSLFNCRMPKGQDMSHFLYKGCLHF